MWKIVKVLAVIVIVIITFSRLTRTKISSASVHEPSFPLGKCSSEMLKENERLSRVQMTRVLELIARHPAKEVRETIRKQILNGDVCVGKRIYGTDNAKFQPIFFELHARYVPFIFIRDNILTPNMEWLAQLVIYHEYIHYKQWIAGRIGDEYPDQEVVADGDAQERVIICKEIWYAEIEAYRMECELARSLGTDSYLAFCAKTQEGGVAPIEEHLIEGHGWSSVCSVEWREFASGR